MFVRDILKTKGPGVVTVAEEATIDDAIMTLSGKNIGAVVVVDGDGGLAGILSERDIIRVLAGAPTGFRENKVTEVMTRTVTTCTHDTSLDKVLSLMTAGRFRHLPVINEGKLAGMLSIGDVVKHRIEKAEREAAALKDYITAG